MHKRSEHLSQWSLVQRTTCEEHELRVQLNYSLAITQRPGLTPAGWGHKVALACPSNAYVSPELSAEEDRVQITEALDGNIRAPVTLARVVYHDAKAVDGVFFLGSRYPPGNVVLKDVECCLPYADLWSRVGCSEPNRPQLRVIPMDVGESLFTATRV